jgi:uncharacterized membrane protein
LTSFATVAMETKKGGFKPIIIFVFFIYFCILAVSMATAAILEKSTNKGRTSHGI